MTEPPNSLVPDSAPVIEQVQSPRYIGLASRGVAAVIDAAIITVVAIMFEFGAALVLSLLHLPSNHKAVLAAIGGALYILWSVAYFVAFWSGPGQTPGARVLQIRVISAGGGRVRPSQAALRCLGVFLAALPLFAGFVPILFDSKRRGFQDYLAHTLVIEAPQTSFAQVRRIKQQQIREASQSATAPLPD
jgi:uncharacterized RDD family membrane protein YckC